MSDSQEIVVRRRLALEGALALVLALAPNAQAAGPVVGINDSRFVSDWPTAKLAPLRFDQVGIGVTIGQETRPWAIPSNVGVVVTLTGDPSYESRPHDFAAATLRLVISHRNVRAVQVWNEPDLCFARAGFWRTCESIPGRHRFTGRSLDLYLDTLAATHDALSGTGVKVLGFGFSPPFHGDGTITAWSPAEVAAGIASWYESRGPHELVARCLATTCAAESVPVSRYPRPIMDGFAYHPYAGWQPDESARIWSALAAIGMPGGAPDLWWTEVGLDTGWTSKTMPLWQGTEADEATRDTAVLAAAWATPHIAGVFNFLLRDEGYAGGLGFQSGLYRPDWSAKPALAAFEAVR